MNKNKITKLKKSIFNSISDNCSDEDTLSLCDKISAIIDDHFYGSSRDSTQKNKSKPYLAPTGSVEKQNSVIRTKGDSQKSDSFRGL